MRRMLSRLTMILVIALSACLLNWPSPSSSLAANLAYPETLKSIYSPVVDDDTLLHLSFDNTLAGADGETPSQSSGITYQAGMSGSAARFPVGSQLHYPTTNNIRWKEGTFEVWLKPDWNGNDLQTHHVLMFEALKGIELRKDGANNLTIGIGPVASSGPNAVTGFNVGNWIAGQWHHVAWTWSDSGKFVRIYVDGEKRAENSFTGTIPDFTYPTMQMGGWGQGTYFQGLMDELRISRIARSDAEISRSFLSLIQVNNISTELTTLHLYPTWRWFPALSVNTNFGVLAANPGALTWTSSNESVATVDPDGAIRALASGTCTIEGSIQGKSVSIQVTVKPVVRQPEVKTVDPFLSTPAPGYLYKVPVVVLRFLPTADGQTIDRAHSPELHGVSLSALTNTINRYDKQFKFQMEERSRFRAYKDPASPPSLGYQIIHYIDIFEHTPPSRKYTVREGAPSYYVDWDVLFERFNLAHYINDLGAKEIWLWTSNVDKGYIGLYDPAINRPEFLRTDWESNMSSPTSGDISNSDRDPRDIPIMNHTYTIFVLNSTRDDVNTHGIGHQVESMLSHVNQLQDGNTFLFWNQFSGLAPSGQPPLRCGNVHFPPNGVQDYDYSNPNAVLSDCEDWRPDNTGQKKSVNYLTWANLPFAWPDNIPPGWIDQAKYLLYWQQNMPGRNNSIPHGTNRMTNWWSFSGDWDASIRAGLGLYEPATCVFNISKTQKFVPMSGSTETIDITCPGGCKWIAASNEPWIKIGSAPYGEGNASLSLIIEPNGLAIPRSGTVAIAGKLFTVHQRENFADVNPGSVFASFIYSLANAGVTVGCGQDAQGNPLYCPGQVVTREQMAAFILRALGEVSPPAPAQQRFADVPPQSVFYPFIDRLAQLGITVGCGQDSQGNLLFCPSQQVTREQMAAFLMRALGETNPPLPASQRFIDVPPENVFYRFIDRLAARNITVGCNPEATMYCPGSVVTREQMAAFLVRAFSL